MSDVVDLEKARLDMMSRRGYRNWASRFGEDFGLETRFCHISLKSLVFLAQGKDKSTFYLFDLIMNLLSLGSGFEFNELNSKEKMTVMERYLFMLDRVRFEYMKRLGWLEGYPAEEFTLVELIVHFDHLAPGLQARTPNLREDHPDYDKFRNLNAFEREELIRELIPKALKEIQDHSTTL
ncbi:MAG: hypothetical protein JRJ65_19925 [Deltaproteobacteria bacterium]|nr:hypothetical protein [Deltaproteobacteria bacterium]